MTGPGAPGARFVGQRVPRVEDLRFVTGRGAYVEDLDRPGALHVAFVRSYLARGTITALDASAALALPGVHAVLTGADLNPLVHQTWVDFEGPKPKRIERPFRPLAEGDVRYVGEPIAMVLAESRYLAEDAAELVEVDVEGLPALVDLDRALEPDAPVVHPHLGSNLAGEMHAGAATDALDAVFAAAPHVVTRTYRQHRYSCVPMETRGLVADWDPFAEELTVWIATQGPHSVRTHFARILGIDDGRVRVIMPDVGGAFGQKMYPMAEEVAVALATRELRRPVRWIEDRRENLMAGPDAREDLATVSAAVADDGTILALRADLVEGVGAFPSPGASGTSFSTTVITGPYRIPQLSAHAVSVFTNTAGRCAYRGPWMIETTAREQLVDHIARELGLDPLEVRRRNVVQAADLPWSTPGGLVLDSVSVAETLEQAAGMIDHDATRARLAQWRSEGRLVGLGYSLFAEPTTSVAGPLASEAATVRMGPGGRVDVTTSSASHGQSLETTLAQVVADELGVDVADVAVHQGDTATTPYGPGTGGSRSAVLTSSAVREAAQEVRARLLAIAADQLEAAADDLELADGRVRVRGTPARDVAVTDLTRIAYAAVRKLPAGQAAGLEAHARYVPPIETPITWSNACHACLVEIDPATGAVAILRYVVSEDCGVMINPNVVEGQIAGGVVQGIGGVLYEHMKYDDDGNPLTTTFVDYLLPTATEVPVIEYGHVETPAPSNPGGHKGMGEGGAIGAPAAVCNAIADALAPLGITVDTQPLGPADIVALLESVGA